MYQEDRIGERLTDTGRIFYKQEEPRSMSVPIVRRARPS